MQGRSSATLVPRASRFQTSATTSMRCAQHSSAGGSVSIDRSSLTVRVSSKRLRERPSTLRVRTRRGSNRRRNSMRPSLSVCMQMAPPLFAYSACNALGSTRSSSKFSERRTRSATERPRREAAPLARRLSWKRRLRRHLHLAEKGRNELRIGLRLQRCLVRRKRWMKRERTMTVPYHRLIRRPVG